MDELNSFKTLVNRYLYYVKLSLDSLQENSKSMGEYQEIRTGYLDQEKSIYFQFHGTGCLFVYTDLKVDFEMPYTKDNLIPLDVYFLIRFWKSNVEKFDYTNSDEIKADFEKARKDSQFKEHPFRSHQIMVYFPEVYNLFGNG